MRSALVLSLMVSGFWWWRSDPDVEKGNAKVAEGKFEESLADFDRAEKVLTQEEQKKQLSFDRGLALHGAGKLVLLPWLLRQRMGPVGALITAVFLAVSPITTITARTAGGEAIAMFAIFLLLAAWVRWQDSRDGRWAITLAAALGLGVASAPLFYSGLAALGIAWFWQTTIGPRLNQPEETGG